MKSAVCFQHVSFEGPGVFEAALTSAGFALERRLVPCDGLPDALPDFLLVMGGPMSVNDPDPWIQAELEFIRRAVAGGIPYLGVCLGSQFLAKAMGGRVYPGREPEIGLNTVTRTPAGKNDPLFKNFPDEIPVVQWHGEGIEPPPDALVLAASPRYDVQAFRVGTRAVGILFHLELDQEGLVALCGECPGDVARSGRSREQHIADSRPLLPLLHEQASRLLTNLLKEAG